MREQFAIPWSALDRRTKQIGKEREIEVVSKPPKEEEA